MHVNVDVTPLGDGGSQAGNPYKGPRLSGDARAARLRFWRETPARGARGVRVGMGRAAAERLDLRYFALRLWGVAHRGAQEEDHREQSPGDRSDERCDDECDVGQVLAFLWSLVTVISTLWPITALGNHPLDVHRAINTRC